MAVAELYINPTESGALSLDLSRGIMRLANPDSAYGYAYLRTLTRLGFDYQHEASGLEPRLLVNGSLETAQANLPALRQQRGFIAHDAARREVPFPDYNRETINSILGTLATRTLATLSPETSPERLAFAVAYPFAKEIHSKGVRGHTEGCKAPWRATEVERALQAEKERLFARYDCIPTNPAIPPEEGMITLASLPDQRSWVARQMEAEEAHRTQGAIDYLESIGYFVSQPEAS